MCPRLDLRARGRVGLDDAIAGRLQHEPDDGADAGLVLDDQDLMHRRRHSAGSSIGSVTSNRAPPSVRFDARMSPPCARAMARQIARPRPAPVDLALGRGRAGTCRTADPDRRPADRARRPRRSTSSMRSSARAEMRTRVPAGVYFAAFSNRLAKSCTIKRGVDVYGRQVRRQRRTRSGGRAGALALRSSAAPTRSSMVCQSRRSTRRSDSSRVRSSTFEIRSDMSRARVSIDCASLRRLSGVELADGIRQRAAGAGDHGQRRAQVVRDRGEECVAQALGLCLDARGLRRMRRAGRARAPARSGRRRSRAGGAAREAGRGAGCRPAPRARPASRASPSSGRYSAGAARQRIGAQPGALTVVGHPLRDRQVRTAQRGGERQRRPGAGAARSRPAAGSPPGCRRPPRRASRPTAARLAQIARGGKLAAHRVQQRRAALARPATRVCWRTLAISVAMTRVTISITEERDQVLHVADGEA